MSSLAAWALWLEKASGQVEEFEYTFIKFDVVDGKPLTWLDVKLVSSPVPLLHMLRRVLSNIEITICVDLCEVDACIDRVDGLDHQVWLIEVEDLPEAIRRLTEALPKLSCAQVEVYLVTAKAREVLEVSRKVAKSNGLPKFMEEARQAAMTCSMKLHGSIRALIESSLLPCRAQLELLRCIVLTSDLPGGFVQEPLDCQMSFWANRMHAFQLLQEYGFDSGQLHPEYTRCLETEEALNKSFCFQSSEAVVGNAELRLQLNEALISPILYKLAGSAPPKIMIASDPESSCIVHASRLVAEDIVPLLQEYAPSSFVCELRLAEVFGRYVGDAEQNLKHSWKVAERLTEMYDWVVLVVSDLELVSRDAASGVERKLITSLLMYLDGVDKSNDRLGIIGVARCAVRDLDEALLRPGRLSSLIPVAYAD